MIADIINAITDLLKTTTYLFVKHPQHTFLVVLLMIAASSSYYNKVSLDKLNVPVAVEQSTLKRTIDLNRSIPALMDELKIKIDASRVVLRQFHNGKYGISGIPFTFVQTTHIVVRPNTYNLNLDTWQSYPMSTMSYTLSTLFLNDDFTCKSMTQSDVRDYYYSELLERYDVYGIIMCPMVDENRRILGVLTASFDEKDYIDLDIKMTDVKKSAYDLSNVLRFISHKEQKPWWNFW